jgi:hypothetical protein
VATHNRNRAPILTDTNMTLYYANADLSTSRYAWWGTTYGDGDMLLAIQSCKYEYIVFEYVPYPDIIENINQMGYKPIAPGVWQKGKFCSAD